MRTITMGSLFTGFGGFDIVAGWYNIKVLWQSEIEPWAVELLKTRFPDCVQLGDIKNINGHKISPVDIITFGSPCQNLSIAGNQQGLRGNQSGLFYEAIRVIREMREVTNGEYPKYIIWENVKGALSSNKGTDFKTVLEEITESEIPIPKSGRWATSGMVRGGIADVSWRVLDAQYWGVPQRRKRVYFVGDYRNRCSAEILFKPEGVSRYTPPRFRERQETPSDIGESTQTASEMCLNDQGGSKSRGIGYEEGTSPALRAGIVPAAMFENHSQDARYTGPLDVAQTVSATYGMGGNNQPFVVETPKILKIRSGCEGGGKGALVQDDKSATLGCNNDQTVFVPKVYGICSKDSNSMRSANPNSGIYEAKTVRTLDGNGGNPSCNQGGIAVIEGSGARPSHHGDGYKESDVMYTLNTVERHAVAHPTYCTSKNSHHTIAETDVANTLVATDYKDPPIINDAEYRVRRLTPTECARLQGFTNDWHKGIVNAKGKEMPDTAAYKGYGNAVATVCAEYPIANIVEILQAEEETENE